MSRFFVGTYSDGLRYFDGQTWSTWNVANGKLLHNNVRNIRKFGDVLYFCTGRGVTVYENDSITALPVVNDSTDIAIDSDKVYVPTDSSGVFYYNGSSWSVWNVSGGQLSSNVTRGGIVAYGGNAYIGYHSYSFVRFNGSSFSVLPYSGVSGTPCLNVDAGFLYLCTNGSGLKKLNATTTALVQEITTPVNNTPKNVWIDGINIYVCYNGGAARYNGSTWTTWSQVGGQLPNDDCRQITAKGDEIAVACYGGGVAYSSDGGSTWETWNVANGQLISDGVSCVFGIFSESLSGGVTVGDGNVVGEIAQDPTTVEILHNGQPLPTGSVLRNTLTGQKFVKTDGGAKAYTPIPVTPEEEWKLGSGANAAWSILQDK